MQALADLPRRRGSLRMELEATLTTTPMPAPMTPANDMVPMCAPGLCCVVVSGVSWDCLLLLIGC